MPSPQVAYTSYLELNTKIAELLDKRVLRVKIPTILLNFAFGKLSETLTNGNQIAADKLIAIGFNFKYKKLDSALSNLLVKN